MPNAVIPTHTQESLSNQRRNTSDEVSSRTVPPPTFMLRPEGGVLFEDVLAQQKPLPNEQLDGLGAQTVQDAGPQQAVQKPSANPFGVVPINPFGSPFGGAALQTRASLSKGRLASRPSDTRRDPGIAGRAAQTKTGRSKPLCGGSGLLCTCGKHRTAFDRDTAETVVPVVRVADDEAIE